MNTTQLIVPMTFMLNIRDNRHQEWYGQDAFYDLGSEDASAWREFVPKSICCVIRYVDDDTAITDPSKLIQFGLWLHESTDFCKRNGDGMECFVFRGKHLHSYELERAAAQADHATENLFNNEGDFKQFKIRRSVI